MTRASKKIEAPVTEVEVSVAEPEVQLKEAQGSIGGRRLLLGIVGNDAKNEETRQFLTPEACGLLTSSGIEIMMETEAGIDLSFTDEMYSEYGVKIVTRAEALQAPLVLSFLPLPVKDVKKMKPDSAVLCTMSSALFDEQLIKVLLEKKITLGVLDNMYNHRDMPVFADIIDEINGRAAIMYAQEALSFLGEGKGVLLGAVGGINPCEVLIIGSGLEVEAAATAAMATGALVTLMDNDVSSLLEARRHCSDRLLTAMIHPKVLYNKVKTADVIILGNCSRPFEMPRNLLMTLKDSVYMLDLGKVEPSVSVPRTVAMALSNVLVNFFNEMLIKDGLMPMIASNAGIRAGIVTFRGHMVDKLVGSYTGHPAVDLNVLLTGTN